MNCKKCGLLIDKDSNFCPYCGERIVKENTSQEYDDPFKNIRIDNTHGGQYQYQQDYSSQNKIQYKDDLNAVNNKKKNNISLIGLILGMISVVLCFTTHTIGLGLCVSIVAFILSIIGLKHSSRGLGIISLIVTIFTCIFSLIITIFMFVGSFIITFSNNYETTIRDYFTDAFFCGFYESKIEGYWMDSTNELLYLDNEGNYYIYNNDTELTDNYYYGNYEVEEGIKINSDETLYADEDYYYYQINTLFNKAKIDGEIYYETIDLIKNGFILKLEKESKNKLILVNDDMEIEFEKR